jgi:hypothetical protein
VVEVSCVIQKKRTGNLCLWRFSRNSNPVSQGSTISDSVGPMGLGTFSMLCSASLPMTRQQFHLVSHFQESLLASFSRSGSMTPARGVCQNACKHRQAIFWTVGSRMVAQNVGELSLYGARFAWCVQSSAWMRKSRGCVDVRDKIDVATTNL